MVWTITLLRGGSTEQMGNRPSSMYEVVRPLNPTVDPRYSTSPPTYVTIISSLDVQHRIYVASELRAVNSVIEDDKDDYNWTEGSPGTTLPDLRRKSSTVTPGIEQLSSERGTEPAETQTGDRYHYSAMSWSTRIPPTLAGDLHLRRSRRVSGTTSLRGHHLQPATSAPSTTFGSGLITTCRTAG